MGKKILILSNHFITLYNFRKELITRLVADGHEIYISMPKAKDNSFFINMGCSVIETPIDRRGINPIKDIKLIRNYIKIMKRIKPDIIFSYTIKPNIYGSIASNLTKIRQVSNITGTGATFIRQNLISEVAKILYKISIKKSYKVFFQNTGDKEFFVKNKLVKSNYSVLPGSGVNLDQYQVHDILSNNETNFIFIGRIMEIKGIDEYLECARIIKEQFPNTNFYVAGFIEEERYKNTLELYHEKGIINYLGFQKDINKWIEKCHCIILPSHGGEGVPNVLLESAAMGRVCIASDISGSNDVIDDGITGYLFEPKNANELTNMVRKILALDTENLIKMGLAGRKKIEKQFDREIVIDMYLNEIRNLD